MSNHMSRSSSFTSSIGHGNPYSECSSPISAGSEKGILKEKEFQITMPRLASGLEGREPTKLQRLKKRKWWVGGILALLLAIGVIVGVVVSKLHRNDAVEDDGSLSGDAPDTTKPIPLPIPLNISTPATGPLASGTATRTNSPSTPTALPPVVNAVLKHRLVVFGASYCDDGHARASQYSASLKPPPYYGGRDSNGIVWVEALAPLIGSNGVAATLHDYAYSGAMIDNSLNTVQANQVPDVKSQINSHIADVKSGVLSTMPIGSKTLIVIWAGINPMIDIWMKTIGSGGVVSSATLATANTKIAAQNNAMFTQINNLRTFLDSTANPADFMILKTPPMESLPFITYTAKNLNAATATSSIAMMKTLNDAYNNGITDGITALKTANDAKSKVFEFDVTPWYQNIFANPSSAGLSNIITPCYLSGSTACSDPADHFFWDSIHMTTLVHQKLAAALAPIINSGWLA